MNLLLKTVAFHDILSYIIALNELSDNIHMSTYSHMHFSGYLRNEYPSL